MDALWAVGQDGRALNVYNVRDLRRQGSIISKAPKRTGRE